MAPYLVLTTPFFIVFLSNSAIAASYVRGAAKKIKVALVEYLSGSAVKSVTANANAGHLLIDQINGQGISFILKGGVR
jgi:hypothetical protein